MLNSVGRSSH